MAHPCNPPENPIVLIPARLGSKRFPGKVLADLDGAPLIVHVWRRAVAAKAGRVVVAVAEQEIADAVIAAGGEAVLTDPGHPSGSDRIFEALAQLDPDSAHDAVVNLQGDLPTLAPEIPGLLLALLADSAVDIATAAVPIVDHGERDNPNVVKAIAAIAPGAAQGRALYFSRAPAPAGEGPLLHHIGVYAYRRASLARFVGLPPGILEQRERLEQLRALEAGMHIEVALVDTVPVGIDTPADLELARAVLSATPESRVA